MKNAMPILLVVGGVLLFLMWRKRAYPVAQVASPAAGSPGRGSSLLGIPPAAIAPVASAATGAAVAGIKGVWGLGKGAISTAGNLAGAGLGFAGGVGGSLLGMGGSAIHTVSFGLF